MDGAVPVGRGVADEDRFRQSDTTEGVYSLIYNRSLCLKKCMPTEPIICRVLSTEERVRARRAGDADVQSLGLRRADNSEPGQYVGNDEAVH